jgi:hypothetical protein
MLPEAAPMTAVPTPRKNIERYEAPVKTPREPADFALR